MKSEKLAAAASALEENRTEAQRLKKQMRITNLMMLADVYRERGDVAAAEECEVLAGNLLRNRVQ